MIALSKKPSNIKETSIKPCMMKEASLVLGKPCSVELAKVFLFDSIMKGSIERARTDRESSDRSRKLGSIEEARIDRDSSDRSRKLGSIERARK